jgi:hypothetical protein
MAGLIPAIHVDPRDKPGDDERIDTTITFTEASL